MKKTAFLLALCFTVIGVLAACGKKTASPAPTETANASDTDVAAWADAAETDALQGGNDGSAEEAAASPTGGETAEGRTTPDGKPAAAAQSVAPAGTTKPGETAAGTTQSGAASSVGTTKSGAAAASGSASQSGSSVPSGSGGTSQSGAASSGSAGQSGSTPNASSGSQGGTANPGTTKQANTKPSTTKPGYIKPSTTKPGTSNSGSDTTQSVGGTTQPTTEATTVYVPAVGNRVKATLSYFKEAAVTYVSALNENDLERFNITGNKAKEILKNKNDWAAYTIQIDFQNNETMPITIYYLDVQDNGKDDVFVNGDMSGDLGISPGGKMMERFYVLAKKSEKIESVFNKLKGMNMRIQYAATLEDDMATPKFVYSTVE